MTVVQDHYVSTIPTSAVKRDVEVNDQGVCLRAEYLVENEVVGVRLFDEDGALQTEWGYKQGKKHGVAYCWYTPGVLTSAEPWVEGVVHGEAKQWSLSGELLGTYTLVNGTGLDVWRAKSTEGAIYVAEIHTMLAGQKHGFEWWLNEDKTLHIERHWRHGREHGVERQWGDGDQLLEGYPWFYVNGERVTQHAYVTASQTDSELPPFREEDGSSHRTFPEDVVAVFG